MALAQTPSRMAIPAPRSATPMPRVAMDAALATFARVTRERHPGVVVLPLRRVGTNGPVLAPATGQVIRPFAAPQDRDALGERDARGGARDDHGVD
jgi:hypothetical protein